MTSIPHTISRGESKELGSHSPHPSLPSVSKILEFQKAVTTPSPTSSESTIDSSSASPSSSFPTLHVCTQEPPTDLIILRVHSRALSSNSKPVFYGGDNIRGDVAINLPVKDLPYVTSVDIQLEGETNTLGFDRPFCFLSKNTTLWSSDLRGPRKFPSLPQLRTAAHDDTHRVLRRGNAKSSSSTSSTSSQTKTTSPPPSAMTSFFGSIRRSQSRVSRNVSGGEQSYLDPSSPHVWPFELNLPGTIAFPSGRLVPGKLWHPSSGLHSTATEVSRDASDGGDEEEKGGVREEVIGHGLGPSLRTSENSPFHALEALNTIKIESEANAGTKLAHSRFRIMSLSGLKDGAEGSIARDRNTFQLPPSFSESSSPSYVEYRLIVIVKMRGVFRDHLRLSKTLVLQYRSYADPVPRLRTSNKNLRLDSSLLLGPDQDPERWKVMPQVVMHVQPKGRRVGRASANMQVNLQLAIARPLSYVRGKSIHFQITVKLPRTATPAIVNEQRKRSSALPTSPSGKDVSAATKSVTPEVSGSDQTRRGAIQKGATYSVPSIRVIASSVQLVRAVYVGEDATNDGPRAYSGGFVRQVSAAMILDDSAGENERIDPEARSSDITESSMKGWKFEKDLLCRTLRGELVLRDDLKPSFAFPRFVLRYALVLFPFEGPSFKPLSTEPLWSETVTIATDPARSDSVVAHTRASSSAVAPVAADSAVVVHTRASSSAVAPVAADHTRASSSGVEPVSLAAEADAGGPLDSDVAGDVGTSMGEHGDRQSDSDSVVAEDYEGGGR